MWTLDVKNRLLIFEKYFLFLDIWNFFRLFREVKSSQMMGDTTSVVHRPMTGVFVHKHLHVQ